MCSSDLSHQIAYYAQNTPVPLRYFSSPRPKRLTLFPSQRRFPGTLTLISSVAPICSRARIDPVTPLVTSISNQNKFLPNSCSPESNPVRIAPLIYSSAPLPVKLRIEISSSTEVPDRRIVLIARLESPIAGVAPSP